MKAEVIISIETENLTDLKIKKIEENIDINYISTSLNGKHIEYVDIEKESDLLLGILIGIRLPKEFDYDKKELKYKNLMNEKIIPKLKDFIKIKSVLSFELELENF